MKRTSLLLGALIGGIALGTFARWLGLAWLTTAIGALHPLGQLWVRALQMTLVPLIFAIVANGVLVAVRTGQGGRLVAVTIGTFLALIAISMLLSTLTLEAVLKFWPLPADALVGLPGGDAAPAKIPGTIEQLLSIIPTNPVQAAAEGQIFPLVVFALIFGFALSTLARDAEGHPPRLPAIMAELAEAMMRMVGWVLKAAPLGIFVLALGIGGDHGLALASYLLHYVGIDLLYAVLSILLAYAVVALTRSANPARFAAAIAGPQAMAAGTCSSLATMPAMIEAARDRLGLPEPVVATVMPLGGSMFRFTSTGTSTISVLLAVHAAGLHPSPVQAAAGMVALYLSAMGAPGLPGSAVIYALIAPSLTIFGAPLAVIPLYIAAINFADPVLTAGNVTWQLTATTLVARLMGQKATPLTNPPVRPELVEGLPFS
jgi:Na+/H+-dicarboxylate symporter